VTLPRLLLHQQKQHVLHVVLDGAGLIRGNRTHTRRTAAAAAGHMTRQEAQSARAAARLMFLQDLHHL
ncbi:hypothetical protein NQD34_013368, partial [Periophthalmus magnuspinnatus]